MEPGTVDEYPLHTACMNGDDKKVSELLVESPEFLKLKDQDGRYPLHWAISFQNGKIVEQLLPFMKKIDLDDITDDSGWAPLHIACSVGSISILKELLEHTIEPSLDIQTVTGVTPLHLACSKKHLAVVKLLIEKGASVRIKDNNGRLPLHRAAAVGSVPIIILLCEAKSPVNSKDTNGWPPLFHALAEGHGDAAVTLVNQFNAVWQRTTDEDLPSLDKVCPNDSIRDYFLKSVS